MRLNDLLFDAFERELDVLNRQLSMGLLSPEEHAEAVQELERDAREEANRLSCAYRDSDGFDEW